MCRVHYGKMTLKIYTKGELVLRLEVICAQQRHACDAVWLNEMQWPQECCTMI
jgi:hypothetical protein